MTSGTPQAASNSTAGAVRSSSDPNERCTTWLSSLAAGGPRYGCFCALADPFAAETLARCGYDWVLVDLQHGMADLADLPGLVTAVEGSGAAPVVRTASADPTQIGRALDLGAWAVVVPMVETAEQAAAAVAATRYAPHGTRSYGPIRGRAATPPTWDAPRCLVMVETATGVKNIEAIAAVPGLLGVLVGPSDLAISLGVDPTGGADYPLGRGRHHDALAAVALACRSAGVVAAVQTAGPDEARLRAGQGYTLISMRSDWLALRSAASAMLAALHVQDGS